MADCYEDTEKKKSSRWHVNIWTFSNRHDAALSTCPLESELPGPQALWSPRRTVLVRMPLPERKVSVRE